MTAASVTLDEVLRAAQIRAASLVPETSGYLALAVGDATARLPYRVEDTAVRLSTEGTVSVERGQDVVTPEEGGRLLRDLLARLLEQSVGSAPGLSAAARPRQETAKGGEAVVEELEAALIPVNRAAARRALARLARETLRAKKGGKLRRRRRRPAEAVRTRVSTQSSSAHHDVQRDERPAAVEAPVRHAPVEPSRAVPPPPVAETGPSAPEALLVPQRPSAPERAEMPKAAIAPPAHAESPSVDEEIARLRELVDRRAKEAADVASDVASLEAEWAGRDEDATTFDAPVEEREPADFPVTYDGSDATVFEPGVRVGLAADAPEERAARALLASLNGPAEAASERAETPLPQEGRRASRHPGEAKLHPEHKSDVRDLLANFATPELDRKDVHEVRTELKALIGLDPTAAPPPVATRAPVEIVSSDEAADPGADEAYSEEADMVPSFPEPRRPTRAARMGLAMSAVLVITGIVLTLAIYWLAPNFFRGQSADKAGSAAQPSIADVEPGAAPRPTPTAPRGQR